MGDGVEWEGEVLMANNSLSNQTQHRFTYDPGQRYVRADLENRGLWKEYLQQKRAWALKEHRHNMDEHAKDENPWYFWRGDWVGKVGNVATFVPVVGQAWSLASNLAELKTGGKVSAMDWAQVIPLDIGDAASVLSKGTKFLGAVMKSEKVLAWGAKIFTTAGKVAKINKGLKLGEKVWQGVKHGTKQLALHTAVMGPAILIDVRNDILEGKKNTKRPEYRARVAGKVVAGTTQSPIAGVATYSGVMAVNRYMGNKPPKGGVGFRQHQDPGSLGMRIEPYAQLAKRLGAKGLDYSNNGATQISPDGTLLVPNPKDLQGVWKKVHEAFVARLTTKDQLQGAGKQKLVAEIARDYGLNLGGQAHVKSHAPQHDIVPK